MIIPTSHARIAVTQTSGTGPAVLLIHGNSSSKEVFANLLEGELGERYHLVALDLPGHGASEDAVAPDETYGIPGYAAATIEVLRALNVDKLVVYGWSLGGYVALELIPRLPGMVGAMISGAPPIAPTAESIQAAYKPNPQVGLFGKPEFSASDVESFAAATYGNAASAVLRRAASRADGRARANMFAGLFAGKFADQRKIIETTPITIAVVDGADDPFVNTDYVGHLKFADLWDRHYYLLRGVGHVPFLQAREQFEPILLRFLADMEKRITQSVAAAKTAAA
jgi:pimeloyl-ACP methyl ester carboxylesterase